VESTNTLALGEGREPRPPQQRHLVVPGPTLLLWGRPAPVGPHSGCQTGLRPPGRIAAVGARSCESNAFLWSDRTAATGPHSCRQARLLSQGHTPAAGRIIYCCPDRAMSVGPCRRYWVLRALPPGAQRISLLFPSWPHRWQV